MWLLVTCTSLVCEVSHPLSISKSGYFVVAVFEL